MASAVGGCNNQNYRHGGSGTRLYRVWSAMKTRCDNENFWAYKDYGGCGITYCNTWKPIMKLTEVEMQNIIDNTVGFTDYCIRTDNNVPVEGSDDFNRLVHAWLAWSAASEQEYK